MKSPDSKLYTRIYFAYNYLTQSVVFSRILANIWQPVTDITKHKQLRALTSHLQTILEAERISMARDIHDELGHLLTAIKIEELAAQTKNYTKPFKNMSNRLFKDLKRNAGIKFFSIVYKHLNKLRFVQ